MSTYTQKMIKDLVKQGIAQDITNFDFDQNEALRKSHNLSKVGSSFGIYGINGGLLKDDDTGQLFAITKRNGTLFQWF